MPCPLPETWPGPETMFCDGEHVTMTTDEQTIYKDGYDDFPDFTPDPAYTQRQKWAYYWGNCNASSADKAEAEYDAGGYDDDNT